MSNYDRGVAYQAARAALDQGRLDSHDYVGIKERAQLSRQASIDFENRIPATQTADLPTPQQRQRNDFEWRTSVRGGNESAAGKVFSPDDGELLVTPNLNIKPGQEIIRPNW